MVEIKLSGTEKREFEYGEKATLLALFVLLGPPIFYSFISVNVWSSRLWPNRDIWESEQLEIENQLNKENTELFFFGTMRI